MPKTINREKLKNTRKILVYYIQRYRWRIILLSALAIISALANAVVPYLSGRLIDAILQPSSMTVFTWTVSIAWALLAGWLIIQLIAHSFDWCIDTISVELGADAFFDYFTRGFSHILYLPVSFHNSQQSGRVARKIDMAGARIENFFGNIIFDLFPQFLSLLVAIGLVFWIEPLLASIIVAGVLLYVCILVIQIRPLTKLQQSLNRKLSNAFGRAFDAMFNAPAVKQATTERYEQRRYSQLFQHANKVVWIRMRRIWAHLRFSQRIIVVAVQGGVFAVSIYLIQTGAMSIGELVAINAYTTLVFGPFVQLGIQWQQIQNGVVDIHEAEKILNKPQEPYRPARDKTPAEINGHITFDHVWFWYTKDQPILKDISLQADPGQTIAIVGESGVGKSTLIELISGYYFPKRGAVRVDNVNIRNMDLTSLRRHIAVVAQDIVLFNDTIKRNISYGAPGATDEEITEAARKARILTDIEDFPNGWRQQVGERGIKLSVGQKQRVAIARAILRDPTILILDEPTSALDAKTEQYIQQSLDELMQGRTTFVIAHRLSTVRHADTILVMKDGTIVERGTHSELLRHEDGEYRRLHDLQIGLHN